MKTRRFCPKCGRPLLKSQIKGYAFQCFSCDEDFCKFEVLRKKNMEFIRTSRKTTFLHERQQDMNKYDNLEIEQLRKMWEEFGDIPIDNDECIESDFYHWPKGTDRYEIWHWFDERCPNNLHDDLMFPEE